MQNSLDPIMILSSDKDSSMQKKYETRKSLRLITDPKKVKNYREDDTDEDTEQDAAEETEEEDTETESDEDDRDEDQNKTSCTHDCCTNKDFLKNDENYTNEEKTFIQKNRGNEVHKKWIKNTSCSSIFFKVLPINTNKRTILGLIKRNEFESEHMIDEEFYTASRAVGNSLRIFANYELSAENTSLFAILVYSARSLLCLTKHKYQTANEIWSCFSDWWKKKNPVVKK